MNENDFLKPGDSIQLKDKQLMESQEVEELAQEVIKEEGLELGPSEIGYFLIYPNLSKKIAAKCMKASREVKYYSGNDYLLEISGELWDMLDRRTRYMIIFHELLHINPVYKAKQQEWVFKIRKHDYGDFYEIADRHGNEWFKTVQATVSSLYDLDPKDENQVTL